MPGLNSSGIWHALIKTHHITSRKKVAKLRQAADAHNVFVLLRGGGSPGIMYVEGRESGVQDWVTVVQVSIASSEVATLKISTAVSAAANCGAEASI